MSRLLCALGLHRWGLWKKWARRNYRDDETGKIFDATEIYIRHCDRCNRPSLKEIRP